MLLITKGCLLCEIVTWQKMTGYDIFIKQDNRLRAWKDEKKVNYYFLLQRHINELKAKGLISL